MPLLQSNATLTAIVETTAAAGGRDDWFEAQGPGPDVEPDGAGDPKWEGEGEAYFTSKLVQVQGPTGPSIGTVRVLYIESSVAVAARIDTDDVVRWTDEDGTAHEGQAADVRIARLSSMPAELQTTRIQFRD